MATNGTTITLDNGLTRRRIVIADISTAADILPALGAGIKGRIIGGRLSISAAGTLEIRQGVETEPQMFLKPTTAGILVIGQNDEIVSNSNEALKIINSAAATCDGYIDYHTGTDV